MRTSSPKQMAVNISLASAFISAVVLFLLLFSDNNTELLAVIFGILVIFISVFIVVYHMLNSFIFEKINPIYKTIHQKNIPEKDLKRDLEEKDIISEVNDEVVSWAKNKTREIAQLKQMARYRKEFLGNVSHELKTPIFTIQGYVLTLLDGAIDDPEINKKYLKKAEKSINRLIYIVEDLEAITKFESGELTLDYETFDIVSLMKDVFETQELKAKENGIRLTFDSKYDKPIKVYADKERIFQLASNLIVNSINYGQRNGRTTVSFMDMGDNILIEVTDNGLGIEQKDIPRIFERFYRVDKSRSREQGGTGLGLAIVKHVIEAHNQTINVRSTPGKGTSFAFTLSKAKKK
ncbi:MAG: ATP-binding protein [Bacteroidales bacterium]|nr:sensor histidine kinase [Bacteroidales bacterium]MBS3775988.1 sensor histidine kinase [Bacteroidales bacterium]